MAISSKLLNEGEHVVLSTRTHAKALLLPAVVWFATRTTVRASKAATFRPMSPTSGCWKSAREPVAKSPSRVPTARREHGTTVYGVVGKYLAQVMSYAKYRQGEKP